MVKVHGLFRPDGQPVRQYGEDIVEVGNGFDGETLDTIRSLVIEHGGEIHEDPSTLEDIPAPDLPAPKLQDNLQVVPRKAPKIAPEEDLTERATQPTEQHIEEDAQETSESAEDEALRQRLADIWEPQVSDPPPDVEGAPARSQPNEEPARTSHTAHAGAPPVARPPEDIPQDTPRPASTWRKMHIVEGAPGRLLRRLLFRPRPLAVLVIVGVALWRPWFIPGLALGLLAVSIPVAVFAGADRTASEVAKRYHQYHRHAPERAERLRRTVGQGVAKLGWLSDRLPESWVWALYDPEHMHQAREVQEAKLQDRLSRIAAEAD